MRGRERDEGTAWLLPRPRGHEGKRAQIRSLLKSPFQDTKEGKKQAKVIEESLSPAVNAEKGKEIKEPIWVSQEQVQTNCAAAENLGQKEQKAKDCAWRAGRL